MDECPPLQPVPSNVPNAAPTMPKQEPFPIRAAKFSLWLPFVGLGAAGLIAHLVGTDSEKLQPAKIFVILVPPCLIWLGGVVSGMVAMRGMKLHGRQGILGRSLVGIFLNTLFLVPVAIAIGMTAYYSAKINQYDREGTQREYERIKAKVGDGEALDKELVAAADRRFSWEFQVLVRDYDDAASSLSNPPVLDVALVKNSEDLLSREETVEEFIRASKRMSAHSENVVDIYKQELSKHKLSPSAREASLKKFTGPLESLNPKIVLLRQTDVRRGEAMLKTLEFLKSNWGRWKLGKETNKIEFQTQKLSDEYQRLVREVDGLFAAELRLQNELNELRKAGN